MYTLLLLNDKSCLKKLFHNLYISETEGVINDQLKARLMLSFFDCNAFSDEICYFILQLGSSVK